VSDRRDPPPRRPWRRAAPWFVAALLLATIGLPAAAAISRLPTPASVGYARPLATNVTRVNLTDAPGFTPRFLSTAAGTNVSLHLVNTGNFSHTFTLLKQPNVVLNTSWTPLQLDQYFAKNGSLVNVSLAPGAQSNQTVAFNASTGFDSFEFVSVVPYQFQAGMYGFLNITSTAPGVMASENTTDQYQFLPSVLVANGTHYPFNLDVLVTNTGNLGHTFTMAPQSNVTITPANFSAYFVQHPPLVSVNVPSGAGSTVWANFTVPAPGIYQYICEVPGHFANGMTGLLYVGVPAPPPMAPPSTAIIQGWVLVGSALLLGFGVIVAIVSAFAGQMPARPKEEHEHH
jgi:uncharacterized cupredoxin-like copper-binding protein